jgi:hypothetical protein
LESEFFDPQKQWTTKSRPAARSPLPPRPLFAIPQTMAGFTTWFAAAAVVLFVLPGVAEGQGYYYPGNLGTNLCPVGSKQVLSASACQEAAGDLGYNYRGYVSFLLLPPPCKTRGSEERGADGGSRGGEATGGGFEARSGDVEAGIGELERGGGCREREEWEGTKRGREGGRGGRDRFEGGGGGEGASEREAPSW